MLGSALRTNGHSRVGSNDWHREHRLALHAFTGDLELNDKNELPVDRSQQRIPKQPNHSSTAITVVPASTTT